MRDTVLPHKKYTEKVLLHWRANVLEGLDQTIDPATAHIGLCIADSSDFRSLAMIDYYLGKPAQEVRRLLKRSAQFTNREFVLALTRQIPPHEGPFPTIATWGMAGALVAQDTSLAESIAQKAIDLQEAMLARSSTIYWDAFYRMLVYLILDKNADAKTWADKVIGHKRKDQRALYLPLAHATNALVSRDEAQVKAALEEYLAVFDRYAKRSDKGAEVMMAFEAMALIVLARAHGMDIRIDNPYLFYDLID